MGAIPTLSLFAGKRNVDSKMVILFLYLLHRDDHAYRIAANFKAAQKNGSWKVAHTKDLANPSKVAAKLKEMMKRGLLLYAAGEKGAQGEKTQYTLNPLCLASNWVWEERLSTSLIDYWEVNSRVMEDPSDFIPPYNLCELKPYLAILRGISPSPLTCIARICKLNTFDYVTVLAYAESLFQELKQLIDLPHTFDYEIKRLQQRRRQRTRRLSLKEFNARKKAILELKLAEKELIFKYSFFDATKLDSAIKQAYIDFGTSVGIPKQRVPEIIRHFSVHVKFVTYAERGLLGVIIPK